MENQDPTLGPVDVNTLFRALGRIEGKLDTVLDPETGHVSRLNDHEKRIETSEKFRAWLMGGAAGVSAVVTGAFHFLGMK